MRVERLALFNFRNLAKLQLDLSGRAVLLRGANGQGKTNLLEALYVCATGRSFRNAAPRELLRFDAARGHVLALFERQGVRHEIEAVIEPQRRSVRVDGRGVRSSTRLLTLVNVVAFFPDDLRIAKGGPEERRRFLDRAVANYRPEFVDAALAYARVLRSRNALLRAPRPPDRAQLAVYDEQLARHGAVMQRCRVEGLEALAPLATVRFAAIMPAAPPLELALDSGVRLEADEPFEQGLLRALAAAYARDRARGATSVGPHRADLRMRLEGRDARLFASQGQQRAMVLALKLAEVTCLTRELESSPILLLDDVSSELDPRHTSTLFEALGATGCQLWVSTTGSVELPLPQGTQRLEVEAGAIREVAT